jgi:predicted RNase H-like HicB family nuclease
MRRRYAVLVYKEPDPGAADYPYFGVVPALPGCMTAGHSYDEVIDGIQDAIQLYLADDLATGLDIREDVEAEPPHLAVVDVELNVPTLAGI